MFRTIYRPPPSFFRLHSNIIPGKHIGALLNSCRIHRSKGESDSWAATAAGFSKIRLAIDYYADIVRDIRRGREGVESAVVTGY
jgi:hypothetical protein